MKKVMSLLLTLVMALSLLPTAVWAEENDALKTIDAGGRTVYFATGMNEGYLQGGGSVQTGAWGSENIPAFIYTGADADSRCFLAVDKGAFGNSAPALTYQVADDTNVGELTADNTNEQDKHVYELTVPAVREGEVTYLFDLPRADGSDKFAVVFGKTGEGSGSDTGGGDDGGDNIREFECRTVGKDWDGETDLRNMVIKRLKNMTDGRAFIELGVDWRYDEVGGAAQNVGITNAVLQEMAAANKPVLLYGAWGTNMTIPAAAVKDMAGKLTAMNEGKREEDHALLWLKLEYQNCDGPAGNACAFRMRAFLGETHYELPGSLAYTFQLSGQINGYTAFKLYCPADQNDVGTALVEQGNTVSYRDETGDNSRRMYTFTANHDGMFVIAPVGYNVAQSWPWSGVPLPKWQDGGKVHPTQATGYLKTLYDAGYTFPKMNVDLHFQFPDALKEWTPGCGDDWDYKLTWDDSTGIVTVEVNGANKQRWIEAVRDPDNGSELMGGVFFFFYIGNSDSQRPTKYGMELCGEYEDISQLTNEPVTPLSTEYYHSNGFQLADVNRENAFKSTLTINSSGETWFHALALDEDGSKTMQDAAHKFALVVEIKPTENYAYSIRVDNGTPVEKERVHAAATNADWTEESVAEDAMVIIKTVAGKTMEEAGVDHDGMIGDLTVDAPAGYKLAKWWSAQEGRWGNSFPIRISTYLSQRVMLQWENESDPTDTKLEYVKLECHNSQPYFALVPGRMAPSTPAIPVFTVSQTRMKDNGVDVKYDPNTGYFSTTINAAELKDLSVLDSAVTVRPMERAVKYKWLAPGGSESPAMLGQQDADTLFSRFAEVEAEEITAGGQLPAVPLMVVSEMDLGNGTKVYYADSQLYRGLLMQWLDAEDHVLGYSYLYGHNGDLVTAVDTACVSAAPTVEVSKPTIVGSETGEFLCNVDPQSSSDAYTRFFRFSVENEDAIGPDGVTIYLPYSAFGMTAEQGLALAEQGIKPVIWHYLNEACTEKEKIEGEYTEVGIKFVTYGFSPFLITAVQTAGGSASGSESGGNAGDSGSSGGSTGGSTGPQGWVLKTSDKAASATDYSGGIYGLTFRSSASFASFRGVQVDGKTIAAESYITEANGGIEVYLKAAYLKTLRSGKHTVTILSSEGNVSMEFTIGGVNTSADTGDMGVALYAVLALSSIGGMVILPRRRREN